MAVPIQTEPSFSVGPAEPLFQWLYSNVGSRNYDVASDGRFLVVKNERTSSAGAKQIYIMRNWVEELKARVPAN